MDLQLSLLDLQPSPQPSPPSPRLTLTPSYVCRPSVQVCTTTLALGSNELSKDGAIVARLAAIEDMAGMTVLCSDKTGTLTLNKVTERHAVGP